MGISWDEMGNYPMTHPLYGPVFVLILSATKPCFLGVFLPATAGRRDHLRHHLPQWPTVARLHVVIVSPLVDPALHWCLHEKESGFCGSGTKSLVIPAYIQGQSSCFDDVAYTGVSMTYVCEACKGHAICKK